MPCAIVQIPTAKLRGPSVDAQMRSVSLRKQPAKTQWLQTLRQTTAMSRFACGPTRHPETALSRAPTAWLSNPRERIDGLNNAGGFNGQHAERRATSNGRTGTDICTACFYSIACQHPKRKSMLTQVCEQLDEGYHRHAADMQAALHGHLGHLKAHMDSEFEKLSNKHGI